MILNYARIAGRSVPRPRRYLLDRAKKPGLRLFPAGIPRPAIPATCLDPTEPPRWRISFVARGLWSTVLSVHENLETRCFGHRGFSNASFDRSSGNWLLRFSPCLHRTIAYLDFLDTYGIWQDICDFNSMSEALLTLDILLALYFNFGNLGSVKHKIHKFFYSSIPPFSIFEINFESLSYLMNTLTCRSSLSFAIFLPNYQIITHPWDLMICSFTIYLWNRIILFQKSSLSYNNLLPKKIHEQKGWYAPEKGCLVLPDRCGGGRGSRE